MSIVRVSDGACASGSPPGERLDARLERAITNALNDSRPGFVPVLQLDGELSRARAAMKEMRVACEDLAGSHCDKVLQWLVRVNAGQAWVLSRGDMEMMLAAVITASGDLPLAAFSQMTLERACREIKRLSSHEVDAVVRPAGRVLLGRLRGLEILVDVAEKEARKAAEASPVPTNAEREKIIDEFHAKWRTVQDTAAPEIVGAPRPRSVTLTPSQRLAQAERTAASGVHPFAAIAAVRAAALRKVIEADLAGNISAEP